MALKKNPRKVAWRARTTIGLLGFPVRAYEQSVLVCDFKLKSLKGGGSFIIYKFKPQMKSSKQRKYKFEGFNGFLVRLLKKK